MRSQRTSSEAEQIKALLLESYTFKNVFRKDWTQKVMDELSYRLYGKIPRNFLINITGLIGTPSGIFKSTLGLQLAFTLDPMFDLKKRVAFSVNDLLDKVRLNTEFYMTETEFRTFKETYKGAYSFQDLDYGIMDANNEPCTKLVLLRKLIFFLDEQTRTLKTGGLIRLQNLVDTCRERQICFVTCGINEYDMSFSTFDLRRIQESSDEYLPKKQVRYAVYDKARDIYYGYFKWNIWQLDDIKWKEIWEQYSPMKTQFQRVAISQQTSAMNFKDYAEAIMEEKDFEKCFKYTQQGKKVLEPNLLKLLIIKNFPDNTNEDRNMIMAEIKMKMKVE